ncbi:MAG: endospore germination permease [Thermoanaerobacteraceae bacterium]|nr:endospore germination permease [Thermoanaerobacteraceae bacterium]
MLGSREEGFIDPWQGAILLWFSVLPTAILFLPSLLVSRAQQDAWISVIVATLLTVPLAVLIGWLLGRFPGKTLFQASEAILGKILGKAFTLLYVLAFVQLNAIILREFGEFLVAAVMPETPLIVFTATLAALAIYASRNGIEVIARSTQFILPLMVSFFVIVLVLAAPKMSLRNLFPLFEGGIRPILGGAIITWGFTGEIIVMAIIGGFIHPPQGVKRSLFLGLAGIPVFLTLAVIGGLLVFGAFEAGRLTFLAFSLARVISIGNFLERIEVLFMAIWVGGVFIKVTLNLYIAALGLATAANLTEYRPLCAPLAALTVVLSTWLFDSLTRVFFFVEQVFPIWALIWEFIIPFSLGFMALVRKVEGGRP